MGKPVYNGNANGFTKLVVTQLSEVQTGAVQNILRQLMTWVNNIASSNPTAGQVLTAQTATTGKKVMATWTTGSGSGVTEITTAGAGSTPDNLIVTPTPGVGHVVLETKTTVQFNKVTTKTVHNEGTSPLVVKSTKTLDLVGHVKFGTPTTGGGTNCSIATNHDILHTVRVTTLSTFNASRTYDSYRTAVYHFTATTPITQAQAVFFYTTTPTSRTISRVVVARVSTAQFSVGPMWVPSKARIFGGVGSGCSFVHGTIIDLG